MMNALRSLYATTYAIILLAFTTGEATSDSSYNVPIQPRIVGGKPVSLNRFPSFTFTGGNILCGGSLIHEDIILTAAHCLKEAYAPGALIGGISIDGSSSTSFQVVSSTPHPDYDSASQANDVMLVKLASPSTAPIQKLNFDEMIPSDGETVTVIGFGNTADGGTSSPELLSVDLTVVSFADCISYWGKLDPITQLCAGYAPGGKDSCQGDSGGPIMTSSGVQVGLVSMSDGCAKANTPAIYARLSGFSDFILKGVCDLSSNPPDSCSNPNTPVAVPVTAPVAAPVSAPLTTPVSVPVMTPAGVPLPVPTPLIAPVIPSFASPVTQPVTVAAPLAPPVNTLPAPVPYPQAFPSTVPVVVPMVSPIAAPFVPPIAGTNAPVVKSTTASPISAPSSAPTWKPVSMTSAGPTDVAALKDTLSPASRPVPTVLSSSPELPVASPASSPTGMSQPIVVPTPTSLSNATDDSINSTSPVAGPTAQLKNAASLSSSGALCCFQFRLPSFMDIYQPKNFATTAAMISSLLGLVLLS